jgi:hypothetical protein
MIPYDEISNDIQSKVEQLRDLSQIDVGTQLRLWNETFGFRHQIVRDQSTNDILNNFPAYSNSFLVNKFFMCCFFSLNKFLSAISLRGGKDVDERRLEHRSTKTNSYITR